MGNEVCVRHRPSRQARRSRVRRLRILDLSLVGFSAGELDKLLAFVPMGDADGGGGSVPPVVIPEPPRNPASRAGDLWIFGDHRPLCGDATSRDDVRRLMAGERAILFATDPPYLVDDDGSNHPTRNKDWSQSCGVTWDDGAQGAELHDGFIAAALAEAMGAPRDREQPAPDLHPPAGAALGAADVAGAFAGLVEALFADANMAEAAEYRPAAGPARPVRVISRRGDVVESFGAARLWSETTRLDLRVSEVAGPRPGDRLVVGGVDLDGQQAAVGVGQGEASNAIGSREMPNALAAVDLLACVEAFESPF